MIRRHPVNSHAVQPFTSIFVRAHTHNHMNDAVLDQADRP